MPGTPSLPTSLLPAMWRGVPFEAREVGRETGRRLVTHEYPNRDEPYNEDMGRRARRWKLQGFVLGEGAPAIRDLMIAACEKKGPGPLLHPTLGLVQARCEALSVRESVDGGVNVVEFTLDFIEAGSTYSIGLIMTAVALAKAAAVNVAVAALYAQHGSSASDQTARAGTLSTLAGKLSDRDAADAFKDAVDGIAARADVLAADPEAAAEAWQGAFSTVSDATDLRAIASVLEPLFVESGGAPLDTLLFASSLAAAGDAAASATYTTWDDAIAIRDDMARQMDLAALYLVDANTHAALLDLKGAVVQAISDEAVTLPRLRSLSVMRPVPALALAFDLYGDAERASEIVTRNNLSDPCAVAGDLRVLTA